MYLRTELNIYSVVGLALVPITLGSLRSILCEICVRTMRYAIIHYLYGFRCKWNEYIRISSFTERTRTSKSKSKSKWNIFSRFVRKLSFSRSRKKLKCIPVAYRPPHHSNRGNDNKTILRYFVFVSRRNANKNMISSSSFRPVGRCRFSICDTMCQMHNAEIAKTHKEIFYMKTYTERTEPSGENEV